MPKFGIDEGGLAFTAELPEIAEPGTCCPPEGICCAEAAQEVAARAIARMRRLGKRLVVVIAIPIAIPIPIAVTVGLGLSYLI